MLGDDSDETGDAKGKQSGTGRQDGADSSQTHGGSFKNHYHADSNQRSIGPSETPDTGFNLASPNVHSVHASHHIIPQHFSSSRFNYGQHRCFRTQLAAIPLPATPATTALALTAWLPNLPPGPHSKLRRPGTHAYESLQSAVWSSLAARQGLSSLAGVYVKGDVEERSSKSSETIAKGWKKHQLVLLLLTG